MSQALPPGFGDWSGDSKYELRGTLGAGAMGVVMDGFDRAIERRVAIKLVRKPAPDDAEAVEAAARFKREAQAADRLSHPGIAAVSDYGENDDTAWIVMERVDGGALKAVLDRNERLPVRESARIMGQVLNALTYAHRRGVIHPDIKPAEVMLTSEGDAKLADFGIARLENSAMKQVGTLMGTPSYMAPEQLRGEALDAVVMKALAKRPDDRRPDARAFAAAIEAAITAPVAAPPQAAAQAQDATLVSTAVPRPVAPLPLPAAASAPVPSSDRGWMLPAAGIEAERGMPLRKGQLLRFSVQMPGWANRLHVAYATSGGAVARLEPGAPQAPGTRVRLGDPRPGFPSWEIDEPYGTDPLLVVASEGQPFAPGAAVVEEQGAYATGFAAALQAARSAGRRVALRPLVVDTVER